jgi:RNA polymerase sigma factor (sigma-70 family)
MSRSVQFRTTSWSLILAASDRSGGGEALARLCETYWHPVYAFIRRNGHDPDKAQDLTQEFFARLIEKNYVEDADRSRGRFRSFLLTSIKHFLANEWDREQALKRGGGRAQISFDAVEAEEWYIPAVVADVTPETLFERRWAISLLERVVTRLRSEYAAARKEEQFASMEMFLEPDSNDASYGEVAMQMGISAGALRMAVLRMRRRYRELLRAEIGDTVATPEDIDEEIKFLASKLSN